MRYAVTVVWPVYVEVEADTPSEAEELAFDEADKIIRALSIKPIIHELTEL